MSYPSDCPCRNCNSRTVNCHGYCGHYEAWKIRREKELEQEWLSRDGYTNHDAQPYWRKHRKDSRRGQN